MISCSYIYISIIISPLGTSWILLALLGIDDAHGISLDRWNRDGMKSYMMIYLFDSLDEVVIMLMMSCDYPLVTCVMIDGSP